MPIDLSGYRFGTIRMRTIATKAAGNTPDDIRILPVSGKG